MEVSSVRFNPKPESSITLAISKYYRDLMISTQKSTAHFMLILACIAWGGSYAVGRFGLSEGSALWLSVWRWGPGAIIFSAYLIWSHQTNWPIFKSHLPKLFVISLLGVVVYPATLFLAVAETTALNASLYLAISPLIVVLTSSFFWNERMTRIGWTAVVFGLTGALVLVFRGDVSALMSFRVASSDTWAIVSACAWAGYCLSLPLKPQVLSEIAFLAILVVFGSLVLIVMALGSGEAIPLPDTSGVTGSMVYFAVFPSLIAFYAWNWGSAKIGPSIAAPYNNLVPFVGGALGVMFLGEAIERYHLIGGAFILCGLFFNSRRV